MFEDQAQAEATRLMLMFVMNRLSAQAEVPKEDWGQFVSDYVSDPGTMPNLAHPELSRRFVQRVTHALNMLVFGSDLDQTSGGISPSPFEVIDGGKPDFEE